MGIYLTNKPAEVIPWVAHAPLLYTSLMWQLTMVQSKVANLLLLHDLIQEWNMYSLNIQNKLYLTIQYIDGQNNFSVN